MQQNWRSKTARGLQLLDLNQLTRPTSGWCWSSKKHLAKEKSTFQKQFLRGEKEKEKKKVDNYVGLTWEKTIMFYWVFYSGDEKKDDASYLCFEWIKPISLNVYQTALFYNSQKSHTSELVSRQEKAMKIFENLQPYILWKRRYQY